jgi:hypothetical protein
VCLWRPTVRQAQPCKGFSISRVCVLDAENCYVWNRLLCPSACIKLSACGLIAGPSASQAALDARSLMRGHWDHIRAYLTHGLN